MRLVSRGVPFELALKLSRTQRLAYLVVLGELDGRRFDWDAMAWERK